MRATIAVLALTCAAVAQEPAPSDEEKTATPAQENPAPAPTEATESICLLIESAATANGLPVEFFARVIWRESHYNPNAVGPPTRSGQRAQGIGQFMPGTAAERRLLDPFDPVEALPKSAEFLRDYVAAVTGRGADEWAALGATPREQNTPPAPPCKDLNVIIKRAPNTFVAELERHVAEGVARPWGVQLSAGFSRGKALAIYAEIERKYRTVLTGHDPMIIRAHLLTRGTSAFYQVRTGADTRGEADKLCTGLRAAGGHCLVLRNPRG
jgi:transglycosylase-like protein with SLT domain/sporulation related protein